MLASHLGRCLDLDGSPTAMILAEVAEVWEPCWGLENEGSTLGTESLSIDHETFC